jgi:predicted O-methyltransferase YrrM
MAFEEMGKGSVITIDPNFNEKFISSLTNVFPKGWFDRIKFMNATSDDFFKNEECKDEYDMIYIDGDHRYEFVKRDWENSKNRYNKILLFDDYHLPGKVQKDISVSNLIDSIQDESKELIIMDRRIFLDDRGYKDDEIDYGQVLFVK